MNFNPGKKLKFEACPFFETLGAGRHHGHCGHLQALLQRRPPQQGGHGHQGPPLPPPPQHRERADPDTVQHHHAPHQGCHSKVRGN